MELWFDWKGATVWVTSVNTHLPLGVLSLKLLPGSVLPGAEVRTRWLKRRARYSDKMLADSLLIGGFSRRHVGVLNGKCVKQTWIVLSSAIMIFLKSNLIFISEVFIDRWWDPEILGLFHLLSLQNFNDHMEGTIKSTQWDLSNINALLPFPPSKFNLFITS